VKKEIPFFARPRKLIFLKLFIAKNLSMKTRVTCSVLDHDAVQRGIWIPSFGQERHTASVLIN
jgi:hypothetical protein